MCRVSPLRSCSNSFRVCRYVISLSVSPCYTRSQSHRSHARALARLLARAFSQRCHSLSLCLALSLCLPLTHTHLVCVCACVRARALKLLLHLARTRTLPTHCLLSSCSLFSRDLVNPKRAHQKHESEFMPDACNHLTHLSAMTA